MRSWSPVAHHCQKWSAYDHGGFELQPLAGRGADHWRAPERAGPSLDQPVRCLVAAAVSAGKPVLIVVAAGQPELIIPSCPASMGARSRSKIRPACSIDSARPGGDRRGMPGFSRCGRPSGAGSRGRCRTHRARPPMPNWCSSTPASTTVVPSISPCPEWWRRPLPRSPVSSGTSRDLPACAGSRSCLVGLGYTALPQTPLSAKWRGSVTQIWATVVTSAGPVEIIPRPGQSASVRPS